mgnify:CR=1 FL=1
MGSRFRSRDRLRVFGETDAGGDLKVEVDLGGRLPHLPEDTLVDFAVVAFREEGRWEIGSLPHRAAEDMSALVAALSRTEQVRRFALLERELSVEEDELTPTMKVRRARVAERFRDRLDALYTEPAGTAEHAETEEARA